MTKTKKILIPVIALVVVLITVTAILLFLSKPAEAVPTAASHISLAENYLLDLNYEAAIAEYRAAIQIDPKNADYYIALAGVYVDMGDISGAIAVLEEGLVKVDESGRAKIQALIDALTPKPAEMTTTTALTTTVLTTTAETTTAPQEPGFGDFLTNEQQEEIRKAVIGKAEEEAVAYVGGLGLYPLIYDNIQGGGGSPLNTVYDVVFDRKDITICISTAERKSELINLSSPLKMINGMNADDAIAYLESFGFSVCRYYEWNALYEKGTVTGSTCDTISSSDYYNILNLPQSVQVMISAGKSPYEGDEKFIPDLSSLKYPEARAFLENMGFIVLASSCESTYPVDSFIFNFRGQGTYYRDNEDYYNEIRMSVSLGQRPDDLYDFDNPYIVPDLVGLDFTEAENKLNSLNCRINFNEEFNEYVPKGKIIAQSSQIAGQTEYYRNFNLSISAGPKIYPNQYEYIIIPDVTHMDINDATKIFENLGFTVDTLAVEYYKGSIYKAGEVYYQNPHGGSYFHNSDETRENITIYLRYIK
jgi:beta-lactam-binding protein with PASTA domain